MKSYKNTTKEKVKRERLKGSEWKVTKKGGKGKKGGRIHIGKGKLKQKNR